LASIAAKISRVEPRDLILEPALSVEPAGRLIGDELEQPGALEAAARLLADVAAGGADHAVEADHADEPVGADLDRVVEPREIGRIEARRDDAAERAVGARDATRQLHHVTAADAADHRLADGQPVVGRRL
jgi:hypothetical protein